LSVNGFGGGRGQFAGAVGFVEGVVTDSGPGQPCEAFAEARPVADATDDERGVFEMRGEESPGGFDDGVTGLDHLLRAGQVAADEDVNVGAVIYLTKLHGTSSE
jgi:hypothetical protein